MKVPMLLAPPPAVVTNRLLDALPARVRAQVLASCDFIELEFEQILVDPGEPMPYVYFPTTSFISLVTPMGGKDILEVALTGNEGMFGVAVALGAATSTVRGLVQGAGSAWRMSPASFRRELAAHPTFTREVLRYINLRMVQLAQSAGCNRFHVVEKRLARWLLMTADRAHSSHFRITHEFLAFMLGVRRVGITKAATALQKAKLIAYSRGDVAILDRAGLECAACVCYQVDLDSYSKAMGGAA